MGEPSVVNARAEEPEMGWLRSLVATIGAQFIYLLVRVLGREVKLEEQTWLDGPRGGRYIGDKPYEDTAQREGLSVERDASSGGLIRDFDALAHPGFDPGRVHPEVRRFYEETAGYRMDVWASSRFPANLALWLLVTTISRKVNQLNFPLHVLDTAKGMDSEIVLLRSADGEVRYAGWYRKLTETRRVIYTGFYMTTEVPLTGHRCVKVVFPMPNGNATVILRPGVNADGDFTLSSEGAGFGDAGFYRVQEFTQGRPKVWCIRSLKEYFRVYVDDKDVLRCDHAIRFLGLPVLSLHYRIQRK